MAISTNSKKLYIRQQIILQNRIMNKHLKPVYNSLRESYDYFSSIVVDQGVEQAYRTILARPYISPTMGPVITRLYLDAARIAAPKTRIMKGSVIPIFGFVRNVLQYFRDKLLSKVVIEASATTKKHVERELRTSIQEGRGVDETVRALKNEPMTRRRAKMIVRTEAVGAMNYAQLVAADDDKYQVEKFWIAIEDKRTRYAHTHNGVDGETRDLYDTFSNGLQHPGDPNGSAAEVINCRCTLGYQLKRNLAGRPILKRPEDVELRNRVLA